MHGSVMKWVGDVVDRLHLPADDGALSELGVAAGRTLEVGSYDVNGSVRQFFHGPYVGVDMREGPGVDQVAYANDLPFEDHSFDVVISTEMLEHDPTPWLSVAEMARVLRLGGVLILTARGYDERGCFVVHDYPGDYWRYSVEGLTALVETAAHCAVQSAMKDPEAPGVFLWAIR